jgi:SAM-dependent MidA family methyltransferase
VEISPQRGVMMQAICKHIAIHGGSALIGDYGHWGEKEDTLRVCINIKGETAEIRFFRFTD